MTVVDLQFVEELTAGLERGEFVLYYQPEVDLASGEVVGMEALLRWRHPERGLLQPADFVPAAEQSGLMPLLGEWVLDECLREAGHWTALTARPQGRKLLWLNVSGTQLARPGFARLLAGRLGAAGLPSGVVGIEVTEQALDGDVRATAAVLTELHEAGYLVALDDFGAWYSALSHLDELPLDAVKLDQRFVRGVGRDLDDDLIVASVIRLAHAHGLAVVAEGVETWSEGARLCELECDRAYGFLFSGPQPAVRARQLLTRGVGWRGPDAGVPEPRAPAP